jgi:putative FmdB family regulatory protein
MPIYEYRCLECRKQSSILQLSHSSSNGPVCRHCGSRRLERLLSRFSAPKSEEARLASLADDETFGNVDGDDPARMERLIRHMGNEMGEDFHDEMAQAVDSQEEGGIDLDDSDGE